MVHGLLMDDALAVAVNWVTLASGGVRLNWRELLFGKREILPNDFLLRVTRCQ